MDAFKNGANTLFILLCAIMIPAMHAGFAFLELGTVRKKNQVNALIKIQVDFAVSTIVYFFVGYGIAYGVHFFGSAETLAAKNGYELVKFFFLLTFAAAIPAIISGGIAERAKFYPQLAATALLVGLVYPLFEGMVWNQHFGFQAWLKAAFSAEFHDFAGSVVVHAMGGWAALPAILMLGARRGRYSKDGAITAHPPSSIPFLVLGAWILTVGWFGFNVMSAQTFDKLSGLMAMVGGTLTAVLIGKNDPGFAYNGPLAGLVAVCAGSDLRTSDGRARHRQHRRRYFRPIVHADPEQVKNRRRAGRMAAARSVWRLGQHRRRHFRIEGIGRHRRRLLLVAAGRHRGRRGDRYDRWIAGVRAAQAPVWPAPRS